LIQGLLFLFPRGLDWYVCGRPLFHFKFHFSYHLTTSGCMGDIFFGVDMPSFALSNYSTVGAGCKLFLCLPRLPCTRLRAVSLFTYCKNLECTMACMSITVYSGLLPLLLSNNLQQSKSIMAPVWVMRSVPIIPAVSVGSEHTKNVCLNTRLFKRNETVCRHFMSRTSTITPYGLESVTLTSLLEISGCNIEIFEPVSKIRLLDMPSIQTEINGVPHSIAILTGALSTDFSGTVRRKELSSSMPRRFPKLWPPVCLPA